MDWWYAALILFILCNVGLVYGPLVVALLMCYTWDDVASSSILYELYWTWPLRHYFMNGDIIMVRLKYEKCEGLFDRCVCVWDWTLQIDYMWSWYTRVMSLVVLLLYLHRLTLLFLYDIWTLLNMWYEDEYWMNV